MNTAISVSNLTKAFGKNHVLKGVEFSVQQGNIFALLGSNGAGKTTTINILTTLMKADEGVVFVNGFDVAKQAQEVRGSISLTGQFAAVDDMLTARENLQLIGDLRHVTSSAKTATDLLQQFNLVDAADRRVATFSGGMRRRLDIAMSLIGSPAIVFLDEPTTGLDPEARNNMWQTIRKLAKSGITIFLTTQYLEEADELADRVAILHDGKIVANDTVESLKKMVPSGLVELSFRDEEQLANAMALLKTDYQVAQKGEFSLLVDGDETMARTTALFARLRDAKLEPTHFSQQTPTLDDVFFKLIGNKKETK